MVIGVEYPNKFSPKVVPIALTQYRGIAEVVYGGIKDEYFHACLCYFRPCALEICSKERFHLNVYQSEPVTGSKYAKLLRNSIILFL